MRSADTPSASASLPKPLPASSPGNASAGLVATPSSSRTVLLTSNRMRRRSGERVTVGPVQLIGLPPVVPPVAPPVVAPPVVLPPVVVLPVPPVADPGPVPPWSDPGPRPCRSPICPVHAATHTAITAAAREHPFVVLIERQMATARENLPNSTALAIEFPPCFVLVHAQRRASLFRKKSEPRAIRQTTEYTWCCL